jgi:penicillin-binding protein 2
MDRFRYRAPENEVMGLSIGGGPNDQSPLRMAQFYLALGRNGSAPAPRLARPAEGEEPAPESSWTLDLGQESLDALLEGMRQVTAAGGTAQRSRLEHWDLIGKTGTAGRELEGQLAHAWFIGLAGPWGNSPEVVVAVLIEEGESGSGRAAPIASKAVDFYLRRKYGIPVSEVQTYGEHIDTRTPSPWINRNPAQLRNPLPPPPLLPPAP